MDVNLEHLKVMVIDDSKTIRRTAETLLKKSAAPLSPQQTALTPWLKLPIPAQTSFLSTS